MSQIQSLNAQLEEARAAYYAGSPVMSDAEFDVLEQQLTGLNRRTPDGTPPPSVLTTVGTDASGRIKHRHPMRSIENVYSVKEVADWAESLGWPVLTVSGKFDGISCSLTYDKGALVQAVTRGDGDAGESIIDQVRASTGIPSSLPAPLAIEIRGELVIHRSTLSDLNREIESAGGTPYKSPRNLAAGTMKLKDLEEVKKRHVHFIPWEVLSPLLNTSESGEDSAKQRIYDLTEFGFEVPPIYEVANRAELMEVLPNFVELFLQITDPDIGMDGVVVKVDSCVKRRELGYGSKFANFQVAYKVQNQASETTLIDVLWQVGRTGRISPVGVIEPIVLGGAEISRVSLNNLTWIKEMGVHIGSRVKVLRSGDVIPKLVEVLD